MTKREDDLIYSYIEVVQKINYFEALTDVYIIAIFAKNQMAVRIQYYIKDFRAYRDEYRRVDNLRKNDGRYRRGSRHYV